MKKSVLIVAAHPDDEVLGCGGAIVKHIANEDTVSVIIIGEGQTSRNTLFTESVEALKKLHGDTKKVAELLKITRVDFLDFPDNRLDSVDLLDIVKKIEEVKTKVHPDIVYTHHYGDLNIDHRIAFNAVLTAFRPLPNEKKVSIYAFETVSSTEWNMQTAATQFRPTYFLALSEKEIEKKLQAIALYKSEIREFPYPRSLQTIKTLASWRGSIVGQSYSEAFEVIRILE